MPRSAGRPVPPPYTLDRAISDEEEFWKHIGDLIDEKVSKNIEAALVRHGLREAVDAMKLVAKTNVSLVQRVDTLGKHVVGLVANYDQLVGWCTTRQIDEDLLRRRLDKFFEIVTPTHPPPTPPDPDKPT